MLLPIGLGGLSYWLIIYPVDMIKSAMQTDTIIKKSRKFTDVVTTAKVGAEQQSVEGCGIINLFSAGASRGVSGEITASYQSRKAKHG